MMQYGFKVQGFDEVFAITTLDNESSGRLLEKIGFSFNKLIDTPDGETLKIVLLTKYRESCVISRKLSISRNFWKMLLPWLDRKSCNT